MDVDVCVGGVWMIGFVCLCMHVFASVIDFEFLCERDSVCVCVSVCLGERVLKRERDIESACVPVCACACFRVCMNVHLCAYICV